MSSRRCHKIETVGLFPVTTFGFTSECRGILVCIPGKQNTFFLTGIHFGFGTTFYYAKCGLKVLKVLSPTVGIPFFGRQCPTSGAKW